MSNSTLPLPGNHGKDMLAGRVFLWLSRNWLLVLSIAMGLFFGLPFLAPVFMKLGWETPARAIYLFYSFLCHQMPQRSFFLFGPHSMYSLSDIQGVWDNTTNPIILRQYVGDPQLGWKVAWSDRMVSMYTSILFIGWIWYPLRRKLKPLPFWGFLLLLLPMAVDGGSHIISDFAGIGQGFRDSNLWLSQLTNNTFGANFYAGDMLGSFNSWMRLITGVLFALGITWYGFPVLEQSFSEMTNILEAKFQKLEALNKTRSDKSYNI
ncbi:MAG: DUF2085 domain-containing protein [Chloroflexota bacterium]